MQVTDSGTTDSKSADSDTMRALVLEEFGTDLRLRTVTRPVAGPGEVLVRVEASGVNPLDTKIRSGTAAHAKVTVPAILGIDLAGTVVGVGPEVTRFTAGDEVYGMTGGVGDNQGSLAEYAAVDADLLALKPTSLTMRQAAALPAVDITAWEGLVDRAGVHAGADGPRPRRRGRGRARRRADRGGPRRDRLRHRVGHELRDDRGARARHRSTTRTTYADAYVAEHTGGQGFDIIFDTVGGADARRVLRVGAHLHRPRR